MSASLAPRIGEPVRTTTDDSDGVAAQVTVSSYDTHANGLVRRCCIARRRPIGSAGAPRCSEDEGELAEGRCDAPRLGCLDAKLVVSSTKVLDEGLTGHDHRRSSLDFKPRIARSRALSRPWSASMRLLACRSTLWKAPGRSSSMTPT